MPWGLAHPALLQGNWPGVSWGQKVLGSFLVCLFPGLTLEAEGRQAGWLAGCMGAWVMDGWVDAWVGGWEDGWVAGWMNGWVDAWMDGQCEGGWADGWMDLFSLSTCVPSDKGHN